VGAASLTEAITAISAQISLNRVVAVEVAKTIFVKSLTAAFWALKLWLVGFSIENTFLLVSFPSHSRSLPF